MAHSLSELADAAQDRDFQLLARWAEGGTTFWMGDFTAAATRCQQAISLYDFDRHSPSALTYGSDPGATALIYLAMALWFLGFPDRAVARIDQAVALARRCAHPFSLAWATCFAAVIRQFRRDSESAAEWAESTVVLSTEQGFPTWLGVGLMVRAWALAARGNAVDALPVLEQATSTLASAGHELGVTWVLALASEIHAATGHAAQVLPLLTGALTLAEKNSDRWYEAELHRLQGEALLLDGQPPGVDRGGPVADAEECFRRAIEIARSQQAKSFELRAATSLAQLLRRQERSAEARDLLAPIHAWFTEGFATRDLQNAKALLEELG
jgi:adenylate cyclase